jgi:predicted nucleotidyltransferase
MKMDINELLEDNRGRIFTLAKKFGITGIDITGSDATCEVFVEGAVEFLVEFLPDISPPVKEEFHQELLGLFGRFVALVSAEELDGHIRRIVIKGSGS